MKESKFDDKIYFCKKDRKFIHVKWDHSVNKVNHWWWSDYHEEHGYIKGKLVTPKSWVKLGSLPEGTINDLRIK
jgi:hypothetical protein